jgi:hypothetical protein
LPAEVWGRERTVVCLALNVTRDGSGLSSRVTADAHDRLMKKELKKRRERAKVWKRGLIVGETGALASPVTSCYRIVSEKSEDNLKATT